MISIGGPSDIIILLNPIEHFITVGRKMCEANASKMATMENHVDSTIFSFAACGWLKIYYFGVAKGLQESGWADDAVFTGSSSGSLVAAALALKLDFDKVF